ncbi:hypothetical protein ACQ86N_32350 [Puia sp. P3]|uniref:hypothetical protein n=1 Tax=Puia sp. P3 TaxID=3423952 RepID=UPI003D66BE87
MSSRENILKTVKGNQPEWRDLPSLPGVPAGGDGLGEPVSADELADSFVKVLEAIGGSAYVVSGFDRIATILRELYPRVGRVVTACPELKGFGELARDMRIRMSWRMWGWLFWRRILAWRRMGPAG